MKRVVIYTDGACSGNPGVGGWGAVLIYGEAKKEISGAEKMTTNNRMELTAAIKALELLREPCEVELYTDSAYLCNGFNNGWIWNWLKNGWKTASGKPVENRDDLVITAQELRIEHVVVHAEIAVVVIGLIAEVQVDLPAVINVRVGRVIGPGAVARVTKQVRQRIRQRMLGVIRVAHMILRRDEAGVRRKLRVKRAG